MNEEKDNKFNLFLLNNKALGQFLRRLNSNYDHTPYIDRLEAVNKKFMERINIFCLDKK